MLKKFLAAVSTIALALGMVVLTAGPASAHHSTITASFACTGPDAGTITWNVQNWNGGKTGRVVSSTNNIVPVGTEFQSNESKQFTQQVTGAGNRTLEVTMEWLDNGQWKNQTKNSGSFNVKQSDFAGCALPDDTSKKINICHATSSSSNPYTLNNVSVDSIITGPNGHDTHAGDIIPPFTYVKQGVNGSYAGKNWDAYGQWIYNHGCNDDVTAAAPGFAQAQCTGPGTWGSGSYTIPVWPTGVKYQVNISGDGKGYFDQPAGTYPAAVGTTVEVQAVELPGYDLKGTTYWAVEIKKPAGDCIITVTPADPTKAPAVCVADGQLGQGSYTIPAVTGVKYEVRFNGSGTWVEKAAGTHPAPVGAVVNIRAVALPGYDLEGWFDWLYKWDLEIKAANHADKCVDPVDPSFTDSICVPTSTGSTPASYTIPSDTGVKYEVSINGGNWTQKNAGTYQVAVGSTVQVRATATGQYILVNYNGPWSHTFTSPGDCLDEAPVTTPKFENAYCYEHETGTSEGFYIVYSSPHVTYTVTVNGQVVNALVLDQKVESSPNDVVVVTAVAENGYKLTGYPQGGWTHTFTDPGDCIDLVTPATPSFTEAVCTAPGESEDNYYTIPAAQAGVVWNVTVNGDPGDAQPGTHKVQAGDEVVITATPASGYAFPAGTWSWEYTGKDVGDCKVDAPVVKPTAQPEVCVVGENDKGEILKGAITITAAAHVTFLIDGVEYPAGTHLFDHGTYVVTAEADPGYKLVGYPVGGWELEVKKAELCGDLVTKPLVAPAVAFTQSTCTADGSFTLFTEDGIKNGVIWTVNGVPAAEGTTKVTKDGIVNIVAVPADDFGFKGQVPKLEWSFNFTGRGVCGDLETLALTGAPIAGGVALSGLLVIAGALTIAMRRRQQESTQV